MVNKWDIWYCSLDPTQGSEQRGTRPVLVVSNDAVNSALTVTTVLPFSSIKPEASIYPTEVAISAEVSGLRVDSVAMVQQIRTISQSRLTNRVSSLEDANTREKILLALKKYFEC